ncbi:MAG TPA: glucosyl-3-phosphoglycerate synthase [Mycobacteriales bacterium]|nr:glucosyl-3-phosphoglycerate synthase [Mycobacteriales bacterium]
MRQDVREWFRARSYHARDFDPVALLAGKNGTRVSLVLPALDEQDTVGQVVGTLRSALVNRVPLVDEIVVVDSGSTDRTRRVAAEAGARVLAAAEIEPSLGHCPGKGEALWKSLFATSGDILVFVDADLVRVGPHYVTGLLGPLLTDPSVSLVKAFYDRPLATETGVAPNGGGRVTELVARPLLNLYWPRLSGVVQPLAGEYAARRGLLERLPFPRGYGVEIGILIDLLDLAGLDGLAQVDLGRREHSHQSDQELAIMAASVTQTALRRLGLAVTEPTLTQFRRAGGTQRGRTRPVQVDERPPALSVPEYRRGRTTGGPVGGPASEPVGDPTDGGRSGPRAGTGGGGDPAGPTRTGRTPRQSRISGVKSQLDQPA